MRFAQCCVTLCTNSTRQLLIQAIADLSDTWTGLNTAAGASTRAFHIIDTGAKHMTSRHRADATEPSNISVEFDSVTFRCVFLSYNTLLPSDPAALSSSHPPTSPHILPPPHLPSHPPTSPTLRFGIYLGSFFGNCTLNNNGRRQEENNKKHAECRNFEHNEQIKKKENTHKIRPEHGQTTNT